MQFTENLAAEHNPTL